MNPDSSNVELDSVKQAEEGEYVQEGVQQEEGTFYHDFLKVHTILKNYMTSRPLSQGTTL